MRRHVGLAIVLSLLLLSGCKTNDLGKVLEGSQISQVGAAVTAASESSNTKVQKVQTPPASADPKKQEVKKDNVSPANRIPVKVTEIADGDTLTALIDGKEVPIRFLLVDTPEVHGEKAKNGPQFMGPEASAFTKELIKNAKKIEIEKDKGGDTPDKYGRRLYYIYADGKMIQKELLSKGLAAVRYIYEPNTRYLKELKEVEKTAKEQKLGIWSVPGYSTDRYNMEVIRSLK